jgi:hypothetical protein
MTSRSRHRVRTTCRPGRSRCSLTGVAWRAGALVALVALIAGLAVCSYQQHLGDVRDAGAQDDGHRMQFDGPAGPPDQCTNPQLRAVWGSGPNDVWAVGSWALYPDPRCMGIHVGIIRWNGTAWSWTGDGLGPSSVGQRAIWGSGPDDVWVLGGKALRWDGSAWTAMLSSMFSPMNAVWGSGPNDVWLVGGQPGNPGPISYLHYDGASFDPDPPLSPYAPLGLWGTSANDVFAVGEAGMILHYDGASWVTMASGTGEVLYGVWGSSATDVFAVGAAGTILHYDGTTWSTMGAGSTTVLRGV